MKEINEITESHGEYRKEVTERECVSKPKHRFVGGPVCRRLT